MSILVQCKNPKGGYIKLNRTDGTFELVANKVKDVPRDDDVLPRVLSYQCEGKSLRSVIEAD